MALTSLQTAQKTCDHRLRLPLWPSAYFFILLASSMRMGTCPNPRQPDWSSHANRRQLLSLPGLFTQCCSWGLILYLPSTFPLRCKSLIILIFHSSDTIVKVVVAAVAVLFLDFSWHLHTVGWSHGYYSRRVTGRTCFFQHVLSGVDAESVLPRTRCLLVLLYLLAATPNAFLFETVYRKPYSFLGLSFIGWWCIKGEPPQPRFQRPQLSSSLSNVSLWEKCPNLHFHSLSFCPLPWFIPDCHMIRNMGTWSLAWFHWKTEEPLRGWA